jgi:hypothetical protein
LFEEKDCAGILAEDVCMEHLSALPPERRVAYCEKIKADRKFSSFKNSCRSFALPCEPDLQNQPESKKPLKCKPRDFSSSGGPWFDPGAAGCQNLQSTLEQAVWSPQQGGTCTYTLSACGRVAATRRISAVEIRGGKLVVADYSGFTPQQLAARGVRPIRGNECNVALFADPRYRVPPQKVCCDIWQEAVRGGGPCNPEVDADCDGLPNDKDGDFTNSVPYYAPLAANEKDDSSNAVDASDFDSADFDPRPPGLGWDDVMPNEPCKECKWVAMSGKLKCSPDGRQDHEYKATWKCPTSGVERVVTKKVPARFPCKPPNSPGRAR